MQTNNKKTTAIFFGETSGKKKKVFGCMEKTLENEKHFVQFH